MSPDYPALLRRLRDPLQLRAVERIIQFPFVLPAADERTEEEIARAAEKRREQGKKLQEMAAKARLDKVQSPDVFLFFNQFVTVNVTNSSFRRRAICNT
jgi:actin-related protein 5